MELLFFVSHLAAHFRSSNSNKICQCDAFLNIFNT